MSQTSPQSNGIVPSQSARIEVIGVGGGGSNAVNRMIASDLQGVGYRASCSRRANELDLGGWVRNLADGSVEVEAEGPAQRLAEFQIWCEGGPRQAHVTGVGATRIPLRGDDWFEIRS